MVPALTVLLFQILGLMGLIQLRLFVREGLYTLTHHCTGANEHVT